MRPTARKRNPCRNGNANPASPSTMKMAAATMTRTRLNSLFIPGVLALVSFVDAFDAFRLILARLDVLVAAGTHGDVCQKRLFYPLTVSLKGLRREVHRCNNNTSWDKNQMACYIFVMSMGKKKYDVIVIGGGASGMMAAGRAAERGKSVLLLEKNAVVGKKLDITGGGRCNITNAEFDRHAFAKHYGAAEQFLYSPLSQFGVQDTFDFFSKRGLPLVVEARKRAFPETQKSPDVTRVMKKYLTDAGVVVLTKATVKGLAVVGNRITEAKTTQGTFAADTFIISTGGVSHPETGSTGDGFK